MTEDESLDPALVPLMREGAELYNAGQHWDAHEAWEEVWLELRADGQQELADLVQGLILATAAFENLDRGKPRGFATQGAKALHRLREHGDRLPQLGVDGGPRFCEELMDVYLHVQRKAIQQLADLDRDPPRLTIEPADRDEA